MRGQGSEVVQIDPALELEEVNAMSDVNNLVICV